MKPRYFRWSDSNPSLLPAAMICYGLRHPLLKKHRVHRRGLSIHNCWQSTTNVEVEDYHLRRETNSPNMTITNLIDYALASRYYEVDRTLPKAMSSAAAAWLRRMRSRSRDCLAVQFRSTQQMSASCGLKMYGRVEFWEPPLPQLLQENIPKSFHRHHAMRSFL